MTFPYIIQYYLSSKINFVKLEQNYSKNILNSYLDLSNMKFVPSKNNLFFLVLDELIHYCPTFHEEDQLFFDDNPPLNYYNNYFTLIFSSINLNNLSIDEINNILIFFKDVYRKYNSGTFLEKPFNGTTIAELITHLHNLNRSITTYHEFYRERNIPYSSIAPDPRFTYSQLNPLKTDVFNNAFEFDLNLSLSAKHKNIKNIIYKNLNGLNPKLRLLVLVLFWFSSLECNYHFFSASNLQKLLYNDLISESPKPFNIFNYKQDSIYIMDHLVYLNLNYEHVLDSIALQQFYSFLSSIPQMTRKDIIASELKIQYFFNSKNFTLKPQNLIESSSSTESTLLKLNESKQNNHYNDYQILVEESEIFDFLPEGRKLIFYNQFLTKITKYLELNIDDELTSQFNTFTHNLTIENNSEKKIIYEKLIHMLNILLNK